MIAITPTVPETEADIARLMLVARKLSRIRTARPQLFWGGEGPRYEQGAAAADILAVLALVHDGQR